MEPFVAQLDDAIPYIIGGAAVAALGIAVGVIASQQVPPGTVATSITLIVMPGQALVGQPVTLSGVLRRLDSGAGVPTEQVVLEQSVDQIGWSPITTVTTGADGSYSSMIAFQAPGTYFLRARFAGA